MAVFDWQELALDPALRQLAVLVREQFGLWVGLLDEDGVAIPVGERRAEVRHPICERLKVNPLEHADGETTRCSGSLKQWAGRAEAEEEAFWTECHAGFGALIWPLTTPEGDGLGALYLSGHLEEPFDEGRREIREAMERNELVDGLTEDVYEEIPRLGQSKRGLVEAIVERMADRVHHRVEEREVVHPDFLDRDPPRFEGMIGSAGSMTSLFEDIATVADSNSTVLIQGENGTGKELVARALHRRSRRSAQRFVALNCAAIPNQLVESELFGHKKGAFSGAHRDREGLCVEADGGTLFLDEIGDMERSLQSKLLRFLQDGTFSPVGSSRSRSVDVRVICATNQNLEGLVEAGDFRRDLYFRINVIQLPVPPLRERKGDIPLLIDHFLSRSAKQHGRERPELTEQCRRQLMAHDWPGNVRELENEIERLVIMTGGEDVADVDLLSPRIGGEPGIDDFPGFEEMTIPEATEQLERKMLLDGLRETGWNKTRTAENLGVSRRNLIRKVKDYELEAYRDEE